MRQFSIKELERFSDIKAHTIRTWEIRYAIVKPERSSGNIRTYTLEDVKLLLNVSLLTRNGFRISQLGRLRAEEIENKVAGLKDEQVHRDKIVNRLICCMFSGDTDEFENSLDASVELWGIDVTIQRVIIPFLEKAEILSYKDTSIEVHFAVTAVRKKLISGIEHVKTTPNTTNKTALFFLPKGEHYDLLLIYMAYLIKQKGIRTLYLGTNISRENLETVLLEKRPDQVHTYLSSKLAYDPTTLINFIKTHLPNTILYIAEEEDIVRKNSQSNVFFFYFKKNIAVINE